LSEQIKHKKDQSPETETATAATAAAAADVIPISVKNADICPLSNEYHQLR
jgi:hypothetical protein